MGLFTALLYKELATRLSQWKFLVYAVATVILVTGGFLLTKHTYEIKRRNHLELAADFKKTAMEHDRYGTFAFGGIDFSFAPEVLQPFCLGTGALFSRFTHIALDTWHQNSFPLLRTDKLINPLEGFFPPMDLATIVIFFISLMVLIFSHDAVTGERESGTLRLLLSYPVSRARVILAKLLGGYLVTVVPFVFSCLLILLAVQFSPYYHLNGGMLTAAGMIVLLSLVYLLVLYLLGVFVSTVTRKSSTAIAVLITVWLVFIVVVHNLGIMASQKEGSADSVFQVIFKQQERGEKIWDEVKKEGHRRFKTKDTDEWNEAQWQEMNLYEQEVLEKSIQEAVGAHINDLENQYRLLAVLSHISPSLIYMSSVTDLAGTGLKGHIAILRDILAYHAYYKDHISTRCKALWEKEKKTYWSKLKKGIYREFNELEARSVPAAERIQSVLWRFLSLVLFGVVFFLLAFVSFLRADVG